MSASDIQLKTMYEEEGLTPAQIAENTPFSEVAIKAKLMSVSTKYRKDCGQEGEDSDELNFSNEQLKQVNEQIVKLALYSENDKVKADMCKYVRDDKKGRKDQVKGGREMGGFNILQINQMLQGAREVMHKTIGGSPNNNNLIELKQ